MDLGEPMRDPDRRNLCAMSANTRVEQRDPPRVPDDHHPDRRGRAGAGLVWIDGASHFILDVFI